MDTEPTRIISLVNTAIGLTIAALAFALDWSGEAVAVITAVFAGWLAVAGELIRTQVFSRETVMRLLNKTVETGKVELD